MQITTIGLDIAKNVFQVHGIDAAEKVVVRKQLRRSQVLEFFKALPPCLIGMEACARPFAETKRPRARPLSRAYSPKVGKSPFEQDCVVADAVYVERVSATKFPANREINRENREIGADTATRPSLNAVTMGLFSEIPCEN